jgi:CheY-like chemotaxis protein
MAAQTTALRILVVDDDPMSRDLLVVLLEAEGYAVNSAESGEAALALLSSSPIPQVVLADVQMPGLAGSDLARALRERCGRATLLLAMSGSVPASDIISRFDDFLLKPFTMQQIAAAISAKPLAAPSRTSASNKGMNPQTSETSFTGIAPHTSADERPALDIPALDEQIFQQLSNSMSGLQLQQMYAMCMKDARERIAAMRGFAAERDSVQFVRQAHTIKGGCGMLGATELQAIAGRLEKAGLEAPGLDTPGVDPAGVDGAQGVNPLDELSAACDRLERILVARA